MDQFKHIDVQGAQALIEQGQARLVDIRDPQSFRGCSLKNRLSPNKWHYGLVYGWGGVWTTYFW